MELTTTMVFVVVMLAAGLMDLRTLRIPNWLTFGGLGVALVLRGLIGTGPLVDGLAGAGLGFLTGLLLFALRALGGGDGKLLITVGAFFGLKPFVGALLAIGILGGLLGIAEAIRRGVILPSLYNAGAMIKRGVTLGRAGGEARTLESPGAVKVPYGVAIAAGAILWWFFGVPVV